MTQMAVAPAGRRHHHLNLHLPHPHPPHLHLRHRVSPSEWADIHRLHHQDGLAIRAIARTMHLSSGTVRRILAPWN
jgi:DNA-binding NarL/FixJ family response regulator